METINMNSSDINNNNNKPTSVTINSENLSTDPIYNTPTNFKYQVFSNNTESISITNNPDNNLYKISHKNNDKTMNQNNNNIASKWSRLNRIPHNIFDSINQRISFQQSMKLNKCLKYFHSIFTIIGPILIIIFLCLILIYWNKARTEKFKYTNQCVNKECLISTSIIVTNMNKSVEPCENFYKYACGAYYEPFHPDKEADSPSSQANRILVSSFGQDTIKDYFKNGRSRRLKRFDRPSIEHLSEVNVHSIINALNNIYRSYYRSSGSAKYKVAQFFDSCKSTMLRNWYGAYPLMKKITPIIGGVWLFDRDASNETGARNGTNVTIDWPKRLFWDTRLTNKFRLAQNWSWMESIKHLQAELHVPTFADFYISTSVHKSPRLLMVPDSSAWGGLSYYKLKYYVESMLQVLVKDAGIPYGDKEMQNRLKIFVQDLKFISNSLSNLFYGSYRSSWPTKFPLSSLNSLSNKIDWSGLLKAYFNETEIQFDGTYDLYSRYLEYMKKVPLFIESLEKNFTQPVIQRMLNNYMFWNTLESFAWHLSYEYYMLHRSYYFDSDHIMEIDCFFVMHELFDTVLGAIYVENHLHKESEKEVERMTVYLRQSLKSHLNSIPWMDAKTKEDVGKRIDKMKILFKVPPIMQDDTKLNYAYRSLKTSYNYMNNVFSAIQFTRGIYNRILSGISETSEENWSFRDVMAYDTHVALHLQLDELFIPPGMLQLPIYHHNLPAALNFGGMGTLVGTAMGILVGDSGVVVKKNDEVQLLWTSETSRMFQEKRKCLYDQMYNASKAYFNLSDIIMRMVSTELSNVVSATINEASGLDIAESAFENWIADPPDADALKDLPGIQQNAKQLFYLTYAQSYCHNKEIWTEFYDMISSSYNPPYELLVNNILNELPDFAKAFNCPVGSPMNPEKRCRAIL